MKPSLIPNAGEGLFTKQEVKSGQILAYFNGVLVHGIGSDYSIKFDNGLLVDIPENCRST